MTIGFPEAVSSNTRRCERFRSSKGSCFDENPPCGIVPLAHYFCEGGELHGKPSC